MSKNNQEDRSAASPGLDGFSLAVVLLTLVGYPLFRAVGVDYHYTETRTDWWIF